jgi:hypothetical protein
MIGHASAGIGKVEVLGLAPVLEAEVGPVFLDEARLLEAFDQAELLPDGRCGREQALSNAEAWMARSTTSTRWPARCIS